MPSTVQQAKRARGRPYGLLPQKWTWQGDMNQYEAYNGHGSNGNNNGNNGRGWGSMFGNVGNNIAAYFGGGAAQPAAARARSPPGGRHRAPRSGSRSRSRSPRRGRPIVVQPYEKADNFYTGSGSRTRYFHVQHGRTLQQTIADMELAGLRVRRVSFEQLTYRQQRLQTEGRAAAREALAPRTSELERRRAAARLRQDPGIAGRRIVIDDDVPVPRPAAARGSIDLLGAPAPVLLSAVERRRLRRQAGAALPRRRAAAPIAAGGGPDVEFIGDASGFHPDDASIGPGRVWSHDALDPAADSLAARRAAAAARRAADPNYDPIDAHGEAEWIMSIDDEEETGLGQRAQNRLAALNLKVAGIEAAIAARAVPTINGKPIQSDWLTSAGTKLSASQNPGEGLAQTYLRLIRGGQEVYDHTAEELAQPVQIDSDSDGDDSYYY